MKSFDDFWATITDEELERLAKANGEDLPNFTDDEDAYYSSVFSFRMFKSILRRYHQWLMDQLH